MNYQKRQKETFAETASLEKRNKRKEKIIPQKKKCSCEDLITYFTHTIKKSWQPRLLPQRFAVPNRAGVVCTKLNNLSMKYGFVFMELRLFVVTLLESIHPFALCDGSSCTAVSRTCNTFNHFTVPSSTYCVKNGSYPYMEFTSASRENWHKGLPQGCI